MTDLRKILDAATPGPWLTGSKERDSGNIWIAGRDKTNGVFVLPYLAMTMNWPNNFEANARLIAIAPQLAAALIKAEEALIDATAHLVGAESAYREFAKRHQDIRPKAATDPFFTTRVGDFRKAADRARAAYLEISALTGGRHD